MTEYGDKGQPSKMPPDYGDYIVIGEENVNKNPVRVKRGRRPKGTIISKI